MSFRRFAGALAGVVMLAQSGSAQVVSQRSEELARAMERVAMERVFSVLALDHGANLYGAWISGHDLYLEQFGRSGQFEIIALDLRTGERKWVVQTGRHQLKVGPTPGDRYIAFLTRTDGGMIVINRATGARDFDKLRAELDVPTSFAAGSSDTTVYVSNLASSQIVALNPSDARPCWRYPVGSLLTTAPLVTPRIPRRLVVAGSLDGTVTALAAQSWNEIPPASPAWSRRLFGAVNALTVAEGTVDGRRVVSILASCEDRGLYCLDSTSGEPRWVARGENAFKEAATSSGGVVFARAGRLFAIDLATGESKWKTGTSAAPAPWERATAGYACDARRAYLRGEPKEIWRVDPKSGVIVASSRLSEFDYVLAAPEANMIVGLTHDGFVVASR